MREVQLTQDKVALVDDADFERVSAFKWYACRHGSRFYARARSGRLYMHKLIADASCGFDVDHIDGDGLNNVRSNLRICTRRQNLLNGKSHSDGSSRFKGVSWDKRTKRWRANIYVGGRQTHLGATHIEIVAARLYDHYAMKYFGEFARLNGV